MAYNKFEQLYLVEDYVLFDETIGRKIDTRESRMKPKSNDEAIKDSSINFDKVDRTRVGVIWGSGIGGFETIQNEMINFSDGDGTPRFNPFFIPHPSIPGQIVLNNPKIYTAGPKGQTLRFVHHKMVLDFHFLNKH